MTLAGASLLAVLFACAYHTTRNPDETCALSNQAVLRDGDRSARWRSRSALVLVLCAVLTGFFRGLRMSPCTASLGPTMGRCAGHLFLPGFLKDQLCTHAI
jgi:hypothetical protein